MNNIGNLLKNKRESHGLSLSYVSNVLKIREKYLEAIENWDFNELPHKVYAIGYLKNYANFLGFDSSEIINTFKEVYGTDNSINLPEIIYEDSTPSIVVIFISLMISLSAYGVWSSINFSDKKNNPHQLLSSSNVNYQSKIK